MRTINRVIIHCTATPDTAEGANVGFREINEMHAKRGFKDSATGISLGYHYLVARDGLIIAGRPESSTGAHVRGHNRDSLGIAWVGTLRMTDMQTASLLLLCTTIKNRLCLSYDDFWGHHEFTDLKTCPNIPMNLFRETLKLYGLVLNRD